MTECKKINNFILYSATFIFLLCSGFVIEHHELWRDEMAAFLLSRDSFSIIDLFKNVRYEGHSVLWYLCLRFAHYLYRSVFSMQILSIVISTVSVYIFMKFSPFRLWQKLLFIFGYFQFFQYTVIARDYCLILPLLFAFGALYKNLEKNYILISLIILLLSFTNIYALIAGGALFLGLTFEFIFNQKTSSLNKKQLLLFISMNSLAIILGCYQVTPPVDIFKFSNYHGDIASNLLSIFIWNKQYADNLKTAFILGFIGLIRQGPLYWDGGLVSFGKLYRFIFPLIIFLQIYTFFLLRKHKSLFVTYLTFIVSFIVFSYCFFQTGSQRHFGILFLFWLLILWLANYKSINYKNHSSPLNNKKINYSLTILLILQFIGNINASSNDIKYNFSDGKNLAYYLQNNGYLKEGYIISAFPDWAGLSPIGYLPETTKFYYYHGKLFNTYNVSDSRRTDDTPIEKLACEAYRLSIKENKKVLLILESVLYKMDTDLKNFTPIYTSEGISTVGENYDVLLIDKNSKNKISDCK